MARRTSRADPSPSWPFLGMRPMYTVWLQAHHSHRIECDSQWPHTRHELTAELKIAPTGAGGGRLLNPTEG